MKGYETIYSKGNPDNLNDVFVKIGPNWTHWDYIEKSCQFFSESHPTSKELNDLC